MQEEIKRFVLDELLRGSFEGDLAPDDDLRVVAHLDSLGLVRLIGFLGERFGVRIEGGDVVPDNFRNLNAIAAFVEAKRTGGS